MIEIIKTVLVSLIFAATGAGIAWSVTSDASAPLTPSLNESVFITSKGDRFDGASPKSNRLPAKIAGTRDAVTIVHASGEASSTVFRAPLAVANSY
jgi:hypothetical protein